MIHRQITNVSCGLPHRPRPLARPLINHNSCPTAARAGACRLNASATAAAEKTAAAPVSELLQAAETVWPSSNKDAATRVRRFVAELLLQKPDFKASRGILGRVGTHIGTRKALGLTSFESVLLKDPSHCFVIEQDYDTPPMLQLDGARLLACAAQRASNSSSSSSSLSALWPDPNSDPAARVKQWMAQFLLLQPGYTVEFGRAATELNKEVGCLADLGINGKLRSFLDDEPSGAFTTAKKKNKVMLSLNQAALLESFSHAQQQLQIQLQQQQQQQQQQQIQQQQQQLQQLQVQLQQLRMQLPMRQQQQLLLLLQDEQEGDTEQEGEGEQEEEEEEEEEEEGAAAASSTAAARSKQAAAAAPPAAAAAAAAAAAPDHASIGRKRTLFGAAAAAGAAADPVAQGEARQSVAAMEFDLHLREDGAGWIHPSYVPRSAQQQQQQQQQQEQLVGVRDGGPVFGPWSGSDSAASSSSGGRGGRGGAAAAAGAAGAAAAGELWQHQQQQQQGEEEEGVDASAQDSSSSDEEGLGEQQEEGSETGEAAQGESGDGEEGEWEDEEGQGGQQETGSGQDFSLPFGSISSSSSYDSFPGEGYDEAVWSIARLLPNMVRADLQPYMSIDASPSLEEVIIDKGRPVVLRLSDRSARILPYSADIVEALSLLQAVQTVWQQQGRVASFEFSSSIDSDADADGGFGMGVVRTQQQQQQQQQQQFYADISYAEQSAAYRHARDFAEMFRQDGRMGVPGTLHRISVLKNVAGTPVGLTYRLGRHVPDKGRVMSDVLCSMKASVMPGTPCDRAQSLLVLGKPGTGKTTLLRDIARIMSTPPEQGGLGLSVLIVDTSNEIAGDADECHPCIGYARRLMVPHREQQADILVQAVQNHNPDVIIVDEIGTRQEVEAARTIAERGVVMIGTAHGNSLSNLMRNPVLRPLVGGVTAVTLGDEMAKKTNSNVKTRLERAGAATFVSLLELNSRDMWRLHLDVEQSVDLLLSGPSELTAALDPYSKLTGAAAAGAAAAAAGRGAAAGEAAAARSEGSGGVVPNTQIRSKGADGKMWVRFETAAAAEQTLAAARIIRRLARQQG